MPLPEKWKEEDGQDSTTQSNPVKDPIESKTNELNHQERFVTENSLESEDNRLFQESASSVDSTDNTPNYSSSESLDAEIISKDAADTWKPEEYKNAIGGSVPPFSLLPLPARCITPPALLLTCHDLTPNKPRGDGIQQSHSVAA